MWTDPQYSMTPIELVLCTIRKAVYDSKECTYIFGYFVWDSYHMVPPSQVLNNNDPHQFIRTSLNYGYFINIEGFDGPKFFFSGLPLERTGATG